jgi:hypothetical protein
LLKAFEEKELSTVEKNLGKEEDSGQVKERII